MERERELQLDLGDNMVYIECATMWLRGSTRLLNWESRDSVMKREGDHAGYSVVFTAVYLLPMDEPYVKSVR